MEKMRYQSLETSILNFKTTKPTRQGPKRGRPRSAAAHHDRRRERVWRACDRCRIKKIKCNGEFPCKRCADEGMICTAGIGKKQEHEHTQQRPRLYAEVLEPTQVVLAATVQKLYAMVKNHQQWDLGEPELNDQGQPVVHSIASMVGCVRIGDISLSVQSLFPENAAELAELVNKLETTVSSEDEEAITIEMGIPPATYNLSHNQSLQSSDLKSPGLDLDADCWASAFEESYTTALSLNTFAEYVNEGFTWAVFPALDLDQVPNAAWFPSTRPLLHTLGVATDMDIPYSEPMVLV